METIYPLERGSFFPTVKTAGLFTKAVEAGIKFYQRPPVNRFFPKTTPHFARGMQFLTGQPSTSEWTLEEVRRAFGRSADLRELAATIGAALLFISKASFHGDNGDEELVVRYPSLPNGATISISPSNTHIVIDPGISARETVELVFRGSKAFLSHLGWCYLAMASKFGRDRRVDPNERIVEIHKGGWGKPTTATVEVMDEPPAKGGWGKEPTPAKTHREERIEFKGHFRYGPNQVEVMEGEGW